MKKILTLSVTAALLAGCVGNTVAVPNSGASLRGKTITIVKKSSPKHPNIETDANIVGNVVGGLIGGLIAAGANANRFGNVTYQVPSNQIAEKLIGSIASRYSMNYIPNSVVSSSNKGLNALSTKPNKDSNLYKKRYSTDYLLDVETGAWQLYHSTMFTDEARFHLENSIKIINRLSGKEVAQVGCEYDKKWEGDIPKFKDILANNQQFIKDYTQKAIDACVTKAKKEMLK